MSVQSELYSRLSGTTDLTAIVGTRIFPIKAPQDTKMPYVVYQRISGVPVHAMSADADVVHSRFQVTCVADSVAGSNGTNAVAKQVKASLSRWSKSTGNPEILEVFTDNEIDLWRDIDASDVGAYQTALDFIVHHRST